MAVRRIAANDKVTAYRGYEVYQRGPIVYCLEGIKNNGNALNSVITDNGKIHYSFLPELLKRVGLLKFTGQQVWRDEKSQTEEVKYTKLIAIPYYALAHRRNCLNNKSHENNIINYSVFISKSEYIFTKLWAI